MKTLPSKDAAEPTQKHGADNHINDPHHCRSKNKTDQELKTYYLTPHNSIEYFSLAILQRLGINTPKIQINLRQLKPEESHEWTENIIATKKIDNYIPIIAVRHEEKISSKHTDLLEFRKKYKLNINKQIILDIEKNKEFKICGNLFSADIVATLIADRDPQSTDYNIGLMKTGTRFQAAAINKDHASFNGDNYEQLCEIVNLQMKTNTLFKSRTSEQALSVVYEIYKATVPGKNGQCDFDKIFLDPKVETTLSHTETKNPNRHCNAIHKEYCEKLKSSALSLIAHYKSKEGETCLKDFSERERIRSEIANKIIQHFVISGDTSDIERLIMEDLRGPFYTQHFNSKSGQISKADLHNTKLIAMITADIQEEFNFPAKKVTIVDQAALSTR